MGAFLVRYSVAVPLLVATWIFTGLYWLIPARGEIQLRSQSGSDDGDRGWRAAMLCDARTSNFVSRALAQLAEQLTLNQRVRGSESWRRTIVFA